MNNLKRILSLALASVMVLGMMVVGASASDFTDNEDISHVAAVDTMAALGIIGGYEDGSFRPEGDVTRAEMAKMLSVALNGGKDPNVGLPTTMPYSDVKATDWFAEYVMYCSNLGIIGGRGNGTFDPYGKVTAAEAAKMMLVALGFDPEIFQLVGANWDTSTMRLAQSLLIKQDKDDLSDAKPLSLFGGLTSIASNTPLNRDQTAQLIYNGIQSQTVKMALTGVTGSGVVGGIIGDTTNAKPTYEWSLTGPSILEDKFQADWTSGVLTKAEYTPAKGGAAAYWTYELTPYAADGVVLSKTSKSYDFSKDVSDSFMQTVRVLYRTERGNRTTVLAITASDNVVESTAWGDLAVSSTRGTVNGYGLGVKEAAKDGKPDQYYTTDELPVYTFLGTAGTYGDRKTAYHKYDTANLIDSNGDGRIDCIVVTPVNVSTVAAVRPSYIQVRGLAKNVILKDNKVADGLAIGDWVTYTQNPETEVFTVEKAEIINGQMNASRKSNTTRPDQVQVAGTWYTVAGNNFDTLAGFVGDEVNMVVVAGYVVDGTRVGQAATSSDAVMVVAVAEDPMTVTTSVDVTKTYLEIRVLNADGKTEVLKATVAGADGKITKGAIKVGELYTYTNDPYAPGCVVTTKYTPAIGSAADDDFGYAINKGEITLKKGGIAEGKDTDDNSQSFRFADDAKIFVLVGGTKIDGKDAPVKYAVVTGADINKWGNNATAALNSVGSALYADRASNGFIYAQEGVLILSDEKDIPGAAGTSTIYGYVTGNAYFTKSADGKTNYIATPVWNGTENVTVLAKTVKLTAEGAATTAVKNDEKNFTAGDLVSYIDNGDGTVSVLTELPAAEKVLVAWDGKSIAKFDESAEKTIDDNTVVLFIDSAEGEGVADGNITMADFVDPYTPGLGRYANVHYVEFDGEDSKHVKVLVMDTNNRIGDAYGDPIVDAATESAVAVGSLEKSANKLDNDRLPDTDKKETFAADANSAITGRKNLDFISYVDGTETKPLYELKNLESDIGLKTSDAYYLFTLTFEFKDAEATYKLAKTAGTNGTGSKGESSATATAADDPAVLIILCGNKEDGTWTVKTGEAPTYTLKWDASERTMTVEGATYTEPVE